MQQRSALGSRDTQESRAGAQHHGSAGPASSPHRRVLAAPTVVTAHLLLLERPPGHHFSPALGQSVASPGRLWLPVGDPLLKVNGKFRILEGISNLPLPMR